MPLTATFKADFSSFQDAISKAQGSLSAFDGDAKKVERSLGTMMDRFSGRKAAEEAMTLTKAINEIGGATALTGKELNQVNVILGEAIKKYQALGEEAPADMKQLAAETSKAAKATKDMEDAAKKNENALSLSQKASNLLTGAFGQFTAAGLATTAITKLTDGIMGFIDTGTKLPAIQNAFDRLAGGVHQSSSAMLASMQTGTEGLVTDFELMQAGNKAMLLGLPVTTQSMGQLAETATKLGRAMGQDATKSFDDLITALGRSSPMILDNLGLTVKVGEANDAYAAKLNKTAEQLTDAEKKMAFYEAAMEAARKKTEELGNQTATLGEIATKAWTKVGNVVSAAAAEMNVGLGAAVSSGAKFSDFLKNVIEFGPAMALHLYASAAAVQNLGSAGKDIELTAGPAISKYEEHLNKLAAVNLKPLTADQEALAKKGLALGDSAEKVAEGLGISLQSVKKLEESQREAATATDKFNDAMKELNATGQGWYGTLQTIDGETVEAVKYYLDAGVSQDKLATAYGLTAVQVKAVSDAMKEEADMVKFLDDFKKKTHEAAMKQLQEEAKERQQQLTTTNKAVMDGLTLTKQLEADAADFRAKQVLSETDYKVLQIQRWVDKTIAAYPAMGQQLADYTEKVKAFAKEQTDALTHPADAASQALDKLARDAVTSFAVIGGASADLEAKRKDGSKQTGDAVTDELRRQQEAFMSFKGIVVAGTGDMVTANEALRVSMTKVITNAGDWLERKFQMEQAQRDRGEFFLPGMGGGMPITTRASGGPVTLGHTYLVGEQGPELFRPAASGTILPTLGASGNQAITNNFYVNGSIRDMAGPLVAELTRLMKTTRQWPSA
jgi:transposase